MPTSDIDPAAVIEHLQHENERLRMRILKLRNETTWSDLLPIDEVREFLSDPQRVLISLMVFMLLIVPLVKGLVRFIRRHVL